MRNIRLDQIETADAAIKELMTQNEEIFLYFFGICSDSTDAYRHREARD
jgi:hypothetical protein